MKENINEKISFPEGFDFEIENNSITVKKGNEHLTKKFNTKNIEVKKNGLDLVLESKKATKREKKMINTIKAHVTNMINGLREKFEYKLEVVYVHFPVTLELNKDRNEITIKNFLGEKKPRKCKLLPGAEIEINKNTIIIKSSDKNIAGQNAANLETATKIRNRDRRKFQDGIFIVEKCGRPI